MQAYSWALRGFQGLLTMLDDATAANVPMAADEIDQLKGWIARLGRVVAAQEAKRHAQPARVPCPPCQPPKAPPAR